MEPLIRLILDNEDWLMHRLLNYAKKTGYTRYTSTLAEAWRISIAGLSESLVSTLRASGEIPEPGPYKDYTREPAASFGIVEAQRHRARGVSLGMFLGLCKYYRRSYADLVLQSDFPDDTKEVYRRCVEGFFDLVELGFCVEWAAMSENDKVAELQSTNLRLTNEKNKYLTIFESLRDPAIFFDRQNRLDRVNQAADELLFDADSPGTAYYIQEKPGSTPVWLAEELAAFADDGRIEASFERTIETRRGTRHFQVKLKRMLDVSEKFSGTVALLSDISDRKWLENQLRDDRGELSGQLRQRAVELEKINRTLLAEIGERIRVESELQVERDNLKAILDGMNDGIYIVNRDYEIQYTNPSTEREFGPVLDRKCHEYMHDRNEVCPWCMNPKVFKGQTVSSEWTSPKTGKTYEALDTPFVNRDGSISKLKLFRDVTERRRLESIAEAVNIMNNTGYIFSGIRHEIGNPINSTRMTLELLRTSLAELSTEQIGDYLERALQEVSKVIYLIRSLKSYNMFETPQMQTVEVRSFLDSFLGLVRADIEKNDIDLQSSLDPEAVECRADPRALQQVLLNIFTNALDACDGRSDPRISIQVSRARGRVCFRVSDNGNGMTQAQQDQLFLPFRTSKPQGTGLGMVIARRMLQQMDGTIEVTSREGEGTSVDIGILEPGNEKPQHQENRSDH